MQKDKKVFLTNEGLAKKVSGISSFDLVNYAIKMAETEIYSGRELPAGEENLATAILDAIRAGKDTLDFPAVVPVKKVIPQIIDDEILDEVLKKAFVMDETDNVVMADEEE